MKPRIIIVMLLVVNAVLLALFVMRERTPTAFAAENRTAPMPMPIPENGAELSQTPPALAVEPPRAPEAQPPERVDPPSDRARATTPSRPSAAAERPARTGRDIEPEVEAPPDPHPGPSEPETTATRPDETPGRESGDQGAPVEQPETDSPVGQPVPAEEPPSDPIRVSERSISQGTLIRVQTTQGINSRDFRGGDTFLLKLAEDLLADDGSVAAPTGSEVTGFFNTIRESGRVRGVEEVVFSVTEVTPPDGRPFKVRTSRLTLSADKTTKEDTAKVAGGALLGAIIGGIRGGRDGAAKGAAVGGSVGAGVVLATRGKPVIIGPDESFDLTIEAPARLP